jgi:hypothetical protein
MPDEFDAWLEIMVASRWSPELTPTEFARIIALACIERWWPGEDCVDTARRQELPS